MLYSFEDKFNELIIKDNTNESDIERQSLFYILAGNDELYRNADSIYNFDERMIDLEVIERNHLKVGNGAKSLIKLGFNLYNGTETDLLSVFINLDNENFELALNAIQFRFNKLGLNSSVIKDNE